jgi:methylmalonyl-CoA mutase
MPDQPPGTEDLNFREFPPVSTADWEAVIVKDLKGADYEKKLVWRTDEGIPVRPYYRREALEGLVAQTGSAPAQFPFVRGSGEPWQAVDSLEVPKDAIRADFLHEAGAHAVQELGYALAAGVDRLAANAEKLGVDEAARAITFVFAIGSTYFMEIAKLRAARLLWAQAVSAFSPKSDDACRMRIIARTARANKSVADCYANLLRVTTESLSAVIGGCDKLYVEPFGFDAHLARGVERVVREEAHMDAVADPAGGSYYIETLTDAVAREAWKVFQQVEAAGGYAKSVATITAALAQSRAARQKAVAGRRRTIVGANKYPDLKGKFEQVAVPSEPVPPPFAPFRLAEPFEKIRERTEQYVKRTGKRPLALLLTRGDVKMRMARAGFSQDYLGCAGFEFEQSDEYAGTKADVIVLCSSDPEYLPFAQEVCAAVSVPVIVAGNPKEQIDALKATGVKGFIHVQTDAVQTLAEWQDRLGVK